ncbi:phosphohydrolase [uncultured Amnibacterium sp.]|uniref:phosphohydrolase n=1 Tax=uncultured Amnibacterium sp. TaxID=1631851 RepID=UPI0035CA3ED9
MSTEQVALARGIAYAAHVGVVDKIGQPYIDHPRRVAARLGRLDEQAVAWLHVVVEDTDVKEEVLRAAGVDEEVIAAVLLLSRNMGDKDGYYERIKASPLARAVKLADIADNTDPARTALLDEETRNKLAERYRNARRALGAEEENE